MRRDADADADADAMRMNQELLVVRCTARGLALKRHKRRGLRPACARMRM